MLIEGVRKVGSSFTIQNVPIKFLHSNCKKYNQIYLQYKMFLLNNEVNRLYQNSLFNLQYKMFLLNIFYKF